MSHLDQQHYYIIIQLVSCFKLSNKITASLRQCLLDNSLFISTEIVT